MFKALESKVMIDLHGLTVQEVKRMLAEKFAAIQEKHITEFYIITGRGNHINSAGSRGVLKKILPKLLIPYKQNIAGITEEDGSYKIILKKPLGQTPLQEMFNFLVDEKQQLEHIKSLAIKAQQGDGEALVFLASVHLTGQYIEFNDPKVAITMLNQAIQLGVLEAYVVLGAHYRKTSNYVDAIKLLKYAASQGNPDAQFELAGCYLMGEGVKQSDAEAITWMTKAADKGHAYAQSNLGHNYLIGEYSERNIDLAVKYLTAAVAQGVPAAMVDLARFYATGQYVQRDFKKAFNLYLEATYWNDTFALYQVGQYLLDGRSGLPPSKEEAFPWFLRAANLGDGDAQVQVAIYYLYRKNPNIKEGMEFLRKAIDQKNYLAYLTMGDVYWIGLAGERDGQKAYEHIKVAAEGGFAPALFELATMYFTGKNKAVKQDLKLGRQLLEKAAAQNHPQACAILKSNDQEVIESLRHMSQLPADNEIPEFLKSKPDSDDFHTYLIKAVNSGEIVAQAMALAMLPEQSIPTKMREDIYKSFWQQPDEAVLAIPGNKLKFMVVDIYVWRENDLTEIQKQKVMRLLNVLVEQKHPQAYAYIGALYRLGKIVKQDSKRAKQYWLKGAELGDHESACSLGYYYEEKGKTNAVKYKKAFQYHRLGADLGSANSYNQLGLLYGNGRGVDKDLHKAMECFNTAMRLDDEQKSIFEKGFYYNPVFPHAALNLGVLYWNGGKNFPRDIKKAIYWFIKAAKAGHKDAENKLNELGIKFDNEKGVQINKNTFWQNATNNPQSKPRTLEGILNEFTQSLGLTVNWKLPNKDTAWCYIDPKELSRLESFSLVPFVLRETKDKKSILLLEKMSEYNLLEITDQIKERCQKQHGFVH